MVRSTIDPTVLTNRMICRWYIECEVSESGTSLHIAFSIPLSNGYSALERLDRLGAAPFGGSRSEIFRGKWERRWLTIMACNESEDPYDFDKTAYSVMQLVKKKALVGFRADGDLAQATSASIKELSK